MIATDYIALSIFIVMQIGVLFIIWICYYLTHPKDGRYLLSLRPFQLNRRCDCGAVHPYKAVRPCVICGELMCPNCYQDMVSTSSAALCSIKCAHGKFGSLPPHE